MLPDLRSSHIIHNLLQTFCLCDRLLEDESALPDVSSVCFPATRVIFSFLESRVQTVKPPEATGFCDFGFQSHSFLVKPLYLLIKKK